MSEVGERARRWGGPWIGLLVVGTALWIVYRIARPDPVPSVIVASETVVALGQRFEREHARPATAAELNALVDDWVEREILVREARARGLDRADPIVRRRLVQKMGFVLEDRDLIAPTDAQLAAYLAEHADEYRRPPTRGFRHVFVSGDDDAARARIDAIAQRLRDGDEPTGLGQPFAHGVRQPPAARAILSARYGDAFAAQVAEASPNTWVVMRSVFGWHAVEVDEVHAGVVPPLSEVRARVAADWDAQRRASTRRRQIEALRAGYHVRVER